MYMSADVVYHQHISLSQRIWHSSSSVITAGMSSVCHLYMSAAVVYHQHISLCQCIWHSSSSVVTAGMSSVCLHPSLLDLSHVFFCHQVWHILSIFHCFFRSCTVPPTLTPPHPFVFVLLLSDFTQRLPCVVDIKIQLLDNCPQSPHTHPTPPFCFCFVVRFLPEITLCGGH